MSDRTDLWVEPNQRYLMAALDVIRAALARYAARGEGDCDDEQYQRALETAERAMPAPPSLTVLTRLFGLSPFERDVVLMCAGVGLDGGFASLCPRPTFGLALAALPGAHWSALAPQSPLRCWLLVETVGDGPITQLPLRIDEKILHYLAGVEQLDARLTGLLESGTPTPHLPRSQADLASRLAGVFRAAEPGVQPPVVQLCGTDAATRRSIAARAGTDLGVDLLCLREHDIPVSIVDRDRLARLWEREAALGGYALLVESEGGSEPDRKAVLGAFLDGVGGVVLTSSSEPVGMLRRPTIVLEVDPPTSRELEEVWGSALGPLALGCNGAVRAVSVHFPLDPARIHAASVEARARIAQAPSDAVDGVLWDACRAQSRRRLDGLARLVVPKAKLAELVLPEAQRRTLRELVAHVRQRGRVYDDWGFAQKTSRGLGVVALFYGPSGCGKTYCAEALAHELGLDLVKADLSQIVSKWVGESAKNVRRLFEAAESGAVLLLDECDGLFQRRIGDVRTSNDRYAATDSADLLQRIEVYRGLAILTTNMRETIDPAFNRRIRFAVEFPFPDVDQRAEIWRGIFPADTPTVGLDPEKLARLNCAGGSIYSIALRAAVLAADADEPVDMAHVLSAARSECEKLDRPLTATEIGGWLE